MDATKFKPVDRSKLVDTEPVRESLTYWADAWRRLRKNIPAMAGLVGVILIILFGFVGPLFSPLTYSDQNIDFSNLPPELELYEIADDFYVIKTNDFKVIRVAEDGTVLEKLDRIEQDVINKVYTYSDGTNEVILDFSYNTLPSKQGFDYDHSFIFNGNEFTKPVFSRPNVLFPFGTDIVGRSILVRVMFGAQISLAIAFIASLVNLVIGVIYGSIAAYEGGRTDTVMMRIVDLINSIPLILIVIIIMVVAGNRGLITMIIALGSVFWVTMARLVRGQVLSLKNQEFILAAQALGVPRKQIITKHLIPNTIGPIIVSMTMMIPTAVFTEAFISFVGLGVSAPMASWGTLANDALAQFPTYAYQLFYPSMAIAFTMLAFNLLGDGLRDALDPRLRKG